MGPTKKYLDELNTSTKYFTVRVKVKNKGRALKAATNTRYMKLALQDEKGYKMYATLYNDDIDTYADHIHEQGEYDISNATIRKVDASFARMENEHCMSLNSRTIIQQVGNFGDLPVPEYQDISSLPRVPSDDEEFNVAAIVLYVDKPKKINTTYGKEKHVREIVIMDSSIQTAIISAWTDLAHTTNDLLKNAATSFPVVGFTSLKVRQYKGFNLSTTMSTRVTTQPQGEWPDNLRKWVASNSKVLSHCQAQITEAREPPEQRTITSIKQILAKTSDDTIQEEQHWLHIYIPSFDPEEIIMYLGCNRCEKKTAYAGHVIDECPSCGEHNCMSVSRILFSFKATDGSATIPLTAHAENAHKILHASGEELYQMDPNARTTHFKKLEKTLRTPNTYILIAPSSLLSTNRILKWILKSVEAK